MAQYSAWYISSTMGAGSRGVDFKSTAICAEEIKGDVEEWTGSEMTKAKNAQIKCIDDITCACKNLEISGLQYQTSRNGHYIIDETFLNGRLGF